MTDELWPSAFVATIFAVHPQHVESVAWVSERRDVLSGLFFMLTLGAYLGYVRHGRPPGAICSRRRFCARPDGQADARHAPAAARALGFLAAGPIWFGRRHSSLDSIGRAARPRLPAAGKATTFCTRGGRLLDDLANARARKCAGCLVGTDRQCGGFLRHLRRTVFLSRRPGRLLPDSPRWSAHLESGRRHRDSGRRQRGRGDLATQISLLLCRLVLVLGHADSGARTGPSFRSHDGRSLHVSTRHWALHRAGLGGYAARRRLARVALGAGGLCRAGDCRSRLLGRVADVILARRRNAVEARFGGYHRQRQSRIWPGRRAGSPGSARRRGRPLSPRRRDATDSAPFNSLGTLLAREGKFEEAIAQFRRRWKSNPIRSWCV